jgi:hypothetical protein
MSVPVASTPVSSGSPAGSTSAVERAVPLFIDVAPNGVPRLTPDPAPDQPPASTPESTPAVTPAPPRPGPPLLTPAGLPWRKRPAQTDTGTGTGTGMAEPVDPPSSSQAGRGADDVRDLMASYRSGTLRGRTDAARLTDPNQPSDHPPDHPTGRLAPEPRAPATEE